MDSLASSLSIVIPSCGRVHLLEQLLSSIRADAETVNFAVEVLVVDSTPAEQQVQIEELAARFGVRLLRGGEHVGGKRNQGAQCARGNFVLFLDSDVVIRPGTLRAHYDALSDTDTLVAGCLGKVDFVGEPTVAWKVISEMQLTLPFSYPDVSDRVPWGPTPNISFRKEAFFSVGGFDTTLPRYGGEDVDLGLRLTKAGYTIVTSRNAIAEHTIETWSTWGQNARRLFSFGKADYYLLIRHPERRFFDFPTGPLLWLLQLLAGLALIVAMGRALVPCIFAGLVLSFIAYHLFYAVMKKRPESQLSVHVLGPAVFYTMDLAKAWEAIRHGKPHLVFYRLKFLDDLIAQDWPEIAASSWGLTASAFAFSATVWIGWWAMSVFLVS